MAKKNQTPPKSFEDGLSELEQIVAEIETGQIGLEESLVRQERGQFLLQYCRGILDKAEQQIQLLSRSSDGQVHGTPAGAQLNPAGASPGREAIANETARGLEGDNDAGPHPEEGG